jgi:2-keto-4-pentenoate hydratase/2-oxohepta-3-ene-1,7-dioic acid hydratase in catechol pathway
MDGVVPDEMVMFFKPNSSITDQVYASSNELIHYEAEISFLIGSDDFIGVGFGLDLTKRELQRQLKNKGLPWERAKAFSGSAVFSEFVPFDGDVSDLRLQLFINDQLVQQGSVSLMLHKPGSVLKEAKSFITFEDGDILMTGTPQGVGDVKKGDQYIGRILNKDEVLVEQHWQVK